MITFENHQYALFILLSGGVTLLIFIFYCFIRRRTIRKIIPDKYARNLIILGSDSVIITKEILIILALAAVTIAMLRPQWGEARREVHSEGTDIIVALDVSRSMLARDIEPSRLERAKTAVKLIAESLHGDRIGLIVFAGESFLLCPLTSDIGAFMMFIDSAGPDSVRLQGTDMGAMFREALKIFEKKRLTSRTLVVITDGEDHEGGALSEAGRLESAGVRVYTLGVGRAEGDYIPAGNGSGMFYRDREGNLIRTKRDTGLLKSLAEETNGIYMDINKNLSGIDKIIRELDNQQRISNGTRIINERIDRTWIFLLAAAVFIALEIIIPERRAGMS
jgi:Ca-activated chloride channel family protein